MVKDNEEILRKILKAPKGDPTEPGARKDLPKYAYLRVNQHFKEEKVDKSSGDSSADSSDEEEGDTVEVYRKVLKKDGFKVSRVQSMNIL